MRTDSMEIMQYAGTRPSGHDKAGHYARDAAHGGDKAVVPLSRLLEIAVKRQCAVLLDSRHRDIFSL